MTLRWAVFAVTICLFGAANAAEFRQEAGRGWQALEAAIASGQVGAGDTVVLERGSHGVLVLEGLHFDPALTFRGAAGAHVQAVLVQDASGLVIRDLAVWPTADIAQKAVVLSRPNTNSIVFEGLDVRSREDAARNYLDWSLSEWLSLKGIGGVRIEGANSGVFDSQITATGFAITALGPAARIEGNHVRGFTGDAMRALADDSVVSGNTVQDCIKVDDNHDDGFQAWAPRDGSGPLRGLRIEGNRILEWRGPKAHPLRCRLQGIGLFDGPYENLTIANNLVEVTGYHGISLYGASTSRIVNNTVVHPDGQAQDYPWIMLQDAKGGQLAWQNQLANNLAARFSIRTKLPPDQPKGTNVTVSDPAAIFRDAAGGDYRLLPSSDLTSAGVKGRGPAQDIDGTRRPQGAGIDLGAFETR